MTRRRPNFLDPTGQRGYSEEFVRRLAQVLSTLSERETRLLFYRYGLLDGRPRTFDEIARIFGLGRESVRRIESKAMSKLRHPYRSVPLRDFLDDFVEVPEHVRARLLGALDAEPQPLVHCDRHGWSDPGLDPTAEPVRCQGCPCALAPHREGRRRRYCSDACRQAAYRRRRTGRAELGDGTEPA
jgi:ParB-like chromosome segregation protein Spo0J